MVRAYFDSSGDPYGKDQFAVIGAYAAHEGVWPSVESRWRAVLSKYNVDYLHMRELGTAPPRGPYLGWSDDTVTAFVYEAALVIKESGSPLCALVYATNVREDSKEFNPRQITLRCARFCMGRIIAGLDDDLTSDTGVVEVFTDAGEIRFFSEFKRLWSDDKIRKSETWPSKVRFAPPVDMREAPGVQMADLLAWSARRTLATDDIGDLYLALTGVGTQVFSNLRI